MDTRTVQKGMILITARDQTSQLGSEFHVAGESSLENPTANTKLRPGLCWPNPKRLISNHCVSCSEGSFYVFSFCLLFFFCHLYFYHTPPAQGSEGAVTGAFVGGAFYEDIAY